MNVNYMSLKRAVVALSVLVFVLAVVAAAALLHTPSGKVRHFSDGSTMTEIFPAPGK